MKNAQIDSWKRQLHFSLEPEIDMMMFRILFVYFTSYAYWRTCITRERYICACASCCILHNIYWRAYICEGLREQSENVDGASTCSGMAARGLNILCVVHGVA